jgi:hypothetical protein
MLDSSKLDLSLLPKHANEPFVITTESATLAWDSRSLRGMAEVRCAFVPSPRLILEVISDAPNRHEVMGLILGEAQTDTTIHLPERGASTEVFVRRYSNGESVKITVLPKRQPWTIESGQSLALVEFLLPNFMGLFGTRREEKGREFIVHSEEISLRSDSWNVVMSSLPNTHGIILELKEVGGYGITNIGEIRKSGDNTFTEKEAEDVLIALHYFMSFARGRWCSPILARGYSVDGEMSWESWGAGLLDEWGPQGSWCGVFSGDALRETFPGFLLRWTDELWRDAIRTAIYWYVRSNCAASGVDGALVLSQAALEKLSWVSLVQSEGALSSDGFQRLPAADQLRLMLTRFRIPLEIPRKLTNLAGVGREFGLDGPGVISGARNAVIHPVGKQESRYRGACHEAWSLALWYLELSLLHLFGYRGRYSSRVSLKGAGLADFVPWVGSD